GYAAQAFALRPAPGPTRRHHPGRSLGLPPPRPSPPPRPQRLHRQRDDVGAQLRLRDAVRPGQPRPLRPEPVFQRAAAAARADVARSCAGQAPGLGRGAGHRLGPARHRRLDAAARRSEAEAAASPRPRRRQGRSGPATGRAGTRPL
ncbi:MAG: Chaperone protein DnaJ, partial [uncultured Ramlibacter sp.]